MSNDLIRRTWKAATGSSTNKLVLCFLADSANDKQGGKTNWYSMRGIADACELSIPTVKRAVRDLERQSHISVNSGKGRWKKNIYTVHPIATKTEDHEEAGDDEGEFNGITVIPLSDSTDSSSASNGITVSHEWYHGDPRMVSQGSTNGITVIHLNQDEPRETNSNQLTAPIESASAYSHSTEGEEDDETLAILRRLGPSSAPTTTPPEPIEDDDELPLSHVSSEKKKKTGAQKEKGWQPDEYQKVINRWFKRRDWTAWSAKELEAYRAIDEQTIIDGIEDLNAYYSASKEVAPYKRRGILTLLNNWSGDMDKWAEWSAPSAQAELMRRGLGNKCSVSGY